MMLFLNRLITLLPDFYDVKQRDFLAQNDVHGDHDDHDDENDGLEG